MKTATDLLTKFKNLSNPRDSTLLGFFFVWEWDQEL